MMKQFNTYILILALLYSMNLSATDWTNFRGGQTLLGATVGNIPVRAKLKWVFKTGGEIKSSAVIKEERIIIGSTNGFVYCLDIKGKLIWKFETDNSIEAPALILNNVAYIGNLSGNFYALELSSGKLLWKLQADNQIMAGANWWSDGKKTYILVGSYDYFLYCIDASTGKILWKYEAQNYINSSVAIDGNFAVFGGCDGFMRSVDILTGKENASVSIANYVPGSAALENGLAYAGDYDGKVTCADYIKGTIKWSFQNKERPLPFVSSPAINGGRVIIGSRDRFVYCLNKTNGNVFWKKDTGSRVDASCIADKTNVLVANMRGDIMLLRQSDGKTVWKIVIGSPFTGSPAFGGNSIVIGAQDGEIYCIGEK